jgi:hypothetical protein
VAQHAFRKSDLHGATAIFSRSDIFGRDIKKRPEPQSPGRKSTKMSGNCKKHDEASIL